MRGLILEILVGWCALSVVAGLFLGRAIRIASPTDSEAAAHPPRPKLYVIQGGR